MEMLLQWDLKLFYFIHEECANSLFDSILPLIRNKYIWIPVYIGIVSYVLSRFDAYKASYLLLLIIGSVAITDLCSGQFLKKYVQRDRPCLNAVQQPNIAPLVRCSYSYSFPSSHATNHFGLAMMLSFLFGMKRSWLKYLLFGWALVISLAQVYVGVHYPLDIIGGGVLGVLLVQLYIRLVSKWLPPEILT